MLTAEQLRTALEEGGWSDPAAIAAAVRATGRARHEWRVGASREAALEAAVRTMAEHDQPRHAATIDLVAASLLLVDRIGPYGDGRGTRRLVPWLSGHELGAGRRNAADGPAWLAAAVDAAGSLSGRFEPDIGPGGTSGRSDGTNLRFETFDGVRLNAVWIDGEDGTRVSVPVPLPVEYRVALARREMRRFFAHGVMPGPEWQGILVLPDDGGARPVWWSDQVRITPRHAAAVKTELAAAE